VGLGGRYGLAENLDLVGRIGWTKAEISSGPIDVDDDGYLIDAGLRGRVGDSVELEGGARYTDFSDGGDATGLYVGGRFHFNETWALGAEYQDGDDTSAILAYVRASF
jgi:outer membrane cobalamin receptor